MYKGLARALVIWDMACSRPQVYMLESRHLKKALAERCHEGAAVAPDSGPRGAGHVPLLYTGSSRVAPTLALRYEALPTCGLSFIVNLPAIAVAV